MESGTVSLYLDLGDLLHHVVEAFQVLDGSRWCKHLSLLQEFFYVLKAFSWRQPTALLMGSSSPGSGRVYGAKRRPDQIPAVECFYSP